MSERINLTEIEARCKHAYEGRLGRNLARHHLMLTDLPALVAWVKEARAIFEQGGDWRPLLARLEENL